MARNYGGWQYSWISERIASLPDHIERQFLHAYELSDTTEIPENKLNAEYIIGQTSASTFSMSRLSLSKVKIISSNAFYQCSTLQEINFPEVKTIRPYAFGYCKNLSSIYLPQATEIQYYAFTRNSALTELNLPNVEIIGSYAFSECWSLTEINLPKVSSIGYQAFMSCLSLTSVNLPSIQHIGTYAFSGCSSISEVYLSLQGDKCDINSNAFWSCTNLKEITLNFTNGIFPSTFYDTQQFQGCYSIENINIIGSSIGASNGYNLLSRLLYGASAENLYANDLTQDFQTYWMCYNFSVKNIEMNNITSLANYACSNNTSLERIKLKKTKFLGIAAFYNCNKLPYIEFPNLASFGTWINYGTSYVSSTFMNCNKLSIMVLGASSKVNVPVGYYGYFWNSALANTPFLSSAYLGYYGSFYVPASLLATYLTDPIWGQYPSRFTTIEDNLSMLQALGLCSNYGTSSYWE